MPNSIAVVVEQLRRDSGRTLEVKGNPFTLQHAVDVGASTEEIRDAWPDRDSLPTDVAELWTATRSARLFVDVDYGQWGLELLSPAAARDRTHVELEWRTDGVTEGDVVVGAFLGDQELVVVDRDGAVLIALPLDPRADWHRPAASIGDFLEAYVAAHGAKFWE